MAVLGYSKVKWTGVREDGVSEASVQGRCGLLETGAAEMSDDRRICNGFDR